MLDNVCDDDDSFYTMSSSPDVVPCRWGLAGQDVTSPAELISDRITSLFLSLFLSSFQCQIAVDFLRRNVADS